MGEWGRVGGLASCIGVEIKELLLTDPEWGQWSDREIARQCKVSNRFVSNLRHELSVNGSQIASDSRLVQRGGTVYEQCVSSQKRAQSKPTPR